MSKVLFAIEVPNTFDAGMIVGYFIGSITSCLLFTYLLVKTEYFR